MSPSISEAFKSPEAIESSEMVELISPEMDDASSIESTINEISCVGGVVLIIGDSNYERIFRKNCWMECKSNYHPTASIDAVPLDGLEEMEK